MEIDQGDLRTGTIIGSRASHNISSDFLLVMGRRGLMNSH